MLRSRVSSIKVALQTEHYMWESRNKEGSQGLDLSV